MPTHLLSRHRHTPRPALPVMAGIALEHGRLHEACGPARHQFALWLAAAAAPGAVLWLPGRGGSRQLNPDALADLLSPSRFLFVQSARSDDQLWAMEESLRSGAVALAVAEVSDLPGMTAVRRLHLAAEDGGRSTSAAAAPLGLLLTPGAGGAQGIESRWHLAPAHHLAAAQEAQKTAPPAQPGPPPAVPPASSAGRPAGAAPRLHNCWQLQRLRARTLPPCAWHITQQGSGGTLTPHAPAPAADPGPPVPAAAAAPAQPPHAEGIPPPEPVPPAAARGLPAPDNLPRPPASACLN